MGTDCTLAKSVVSNTEEASARLHPVNGTLLNVNPRRIIILSWKRVNYPSLALKHVMREAEIKHRELKTPNNILALEGMAGDTGCGRRHR